MPSALRLGERASSGSSARAGARAARSRTAPASASPPRAGRRPRPARARRRAPGCRWSCCSPRAEHLLEPAAVGEHHEQQPRRSAKAFMNRRRESRRHDLEQQPPRAAERSLHRRGQRSMRSSVRCMVPNRCEGGLPPRSTLHRMALAFSVAAAAARMRACAADRCPSARRARSCRGRWALGLRRRRGRQRAAQDSAGLCGGGASDLRRGMGSDPFTGHACQPRARQGV